MSISGRRETFQQGRLDNVDLKFSNTRWEMVEGKMSGKESARLLTDFIDADGNEHPWNWVALGGTGERGSGLTVVDGKLVAVNSDGDEVESGGLSDGCGAAKLFDALQDLGFSPKKLDKVGDDPSVLDDNWAHFEQKKSGRKSETDGKEFSDLLPTALLDEDDVTGGGGGGGKKSAKKSNAASKKSKKDDDDDDDEDEKPVKKTGKGTSGKGKAATADDSDEDEDSDDAAESEDEDEDEDESDDDEDDDDAVKSAAIDAMKRILSDPSEFVRNYNPKKNDGGLTIKEVYIAGVVAVKGKNKGEVTNLLRDAKFHKANAAKKLYKFDAENGIVHPIGKKGGK